MSQAIEAIVADETAKLQAEIDGRVLSRLESVRQSAQDKLVNAQAELDEVVAEITARTPVEEASETPAEESTETPTEG